MSILYVVLYFIIIIVAFSVGTLAVTIFTDFYEYEYDDDDDPQHPVMP